VSQQGFPPSRHSREPDGGPRGGHHRAPSPGDGAYQDEALYADETGYQAEPAFREEPPYREEPAFREEPAYREEPAFREEAAHGDEPVYRDQAPYPDEARGRHLVPGDERAPDLEPDRGARPRRGPRSERGPRPDRSRGPDRHRPERAGWQQLDPFGPEPDTDGDLPPWAGPSAYPGRPTGTLRRPVRSRLQADEDTSAADDVDAEPGQAAILADGEPGSRRRRGRAAATRLRKSRRRVYRWCGVAIVACVLAAGITLLVTHHNPQPSLYVTSLQQGEFTSVPNACSAVGAPVLSQFLPSAGRTSISNQASATDSQCSFTVDTKPNFLVLEVQAQAYEPFAAAGSDGSASGNARDNFGLAQNGLAHPPKKSPLPAAQISKVTGLGQQAFLAVQNEHVSGIVTDVVTVVVRERNVVITASMSGQESGHGFGPVPVSTLEAGARAAAKAVLAKVMTQPTA
jgi:hypothetical protein